MRKSTVLSQTTPELAMQGRSSQKGLQLYVALEQAFSEDENEPFGDLEPDIDEEEINESVVCKD